METVFSEFFQGKNPVGSYRTYEEWKLTWFQENVLIFRLVLTVPMRNGNQMMMSFIFILLNSSYRTYEEWKRNFSDSEKWIGGFLPYLWGMETGILKVVMFIVNSFLPYLWGMETKPKPGQWTCLSCSYRTYEEWKLNYIFSHLWDDLVLTVPMRNGNSILSILLIFIKPVLTVPMRNGNLDFLSSMFHTTQVLTVPMRNGNVKSLRNKKRLTKFLPYLWGMETILEVQCRTIHPAFLPYLWGMETDTNYRCQL